MFKHCQQPLKRLASLAGGHGALQPQPLAFFPLVARKASTFPTSACVAEICNIDKAS